MSDLQKARALVESLPPTIRIGPHDWRIELWNAMQADSNRRHGECSTTEFRLSLQVDLPTPSRVCELLLHEIGHALFWTYGLRDEDKEEHTVGMFATGWAGVYRDNPWLLKWIERAFAPPVDPA